MSRTTKTGRQLSRRGFLGASLAAVSAAGLGAKERIIGQAAAPAQAPVQTKPELKIKEYRTLGRTGVKVSDVSFGAGNLSNDNVLRAALDAGVNYVDTAEHYERGGSERTVGQVLKTHDRKSFFITTKLNLSFDKRITKADLRDRFMKCLERMGTDYADCLMIHMCTLAQVKYEPYHELIGELKAEGKVRFSGLSNHGADLSLFGRLDDPMDQVVLAAAEDGRFDIMLFVYNFLQREAGEKALKACAAKNIGVTLMKMDPGLTVASETEVLASIEERYKNQGKELPEAVLKSKQRAAERAAVAGEFMKKHGLDAAEKVRDAAIMFCLNNPGVHAVCPTINSFEGLETFLKLSGRKLDLAAGRVLDDGRAVFGDTYCRHACGLCEPACPRGVPVNSIMRYEYYFGAKGREKEAESARGMLESRKLLRSHRGGPRYFVGLRRRGCGRMSRCRSHRRV
ncbi:MAG: aldo/keto reductase, partial [Candidatus Aminicenantes bacterium]|nr:aldo/keto reductase [Candidatus Aminicenantes bacterium]